MKVLVLGSTGMLGSAVGPHFLQTDHDVTLTYRNASIAYGDDKIKFAVGDDLERLGAGYDYVLNCIGTIKPFMKSNPQEARYINAVFPWELSKWCENIGAKLIHITTDCVYSGKIDDNSSYTESNVHDALDDYGKSKSLGEPDDCMVIRTSIIGEEIHKNASLIEWAKSQKGKQVKGFTNHLWNGITTKQYAKVCQDIIEKDLWDIGLFHVFSKDIVTKLQMLEYFDEKFKLNLQIEPFAAPSSCNRSLGSSKPLVDALGVPTVREQIQAL